MTEHLVFLTIVLEAIAPAPGIDHRQRPGKGAALGVRLAVQAERTDRKPITSASGPENTRIGG
jgi:hypothetical protein